MIDTREQKVIDFISQPKEASSKEVFEGLNIPVSYATLKRILAKLVSSNYLSTKGRGKGTKYVVSPVYEVVRPIDIEKYYQKEIDEQEVKKTFDLSIINDVLAKHSVFTKDEIIALSLLQKT